MTDFALVQACEERIINAWPSLDAVLMDGWIVRLANGYSGRANSASALVPGARLEDHHLDVIERLFAAKGLSPCIRLTPLAHPDVTVKVRNRGYRQLNASIGMAASLAGFGATIPDDMHIHSAANDGWIRGVSARQEGSKRDADAALSAIVSRVLMPSAFAALMLEGQDVGFGMSVVDRGMAEIGSILLDVDFRGKGHGRRLVRGLMDWAANEGAKTAFLQVEGSNAAAITLYRSLGFTEIYRYSTMVLR